MLLFFTGDRYLVLCGARRRGDKDLCKGEPFTRVESAFPGTEHGLRGGKVGKTWVGNISLVFLPCQLNHGSL